MLTELLLCLFTGLAPFCISC